MSSRPLNFIGVLITVIGMLVAIFYFQNHLGYEPCNLCIFQRIGMIATGIVCLIAFLHNSRGWGARVWGLLITLAATAGAAVSIKHIYVQSLPDNVDAGCGMPIDAMTGFMNYGEIAKTVLMSNGKCSDINWSLLGMSIPSLTLISFIVLALIGLIQLFGRRRHSW